MMELQIVSKETIKPLSATPPQLKKLPLSLFDQQAPKMYIHLLYFYYNHDISSGYSRQLLKDSLSKALTFYYPFAGRLRDDGNSINCNDVGAIVSEAKLRCPMSEFMNNFNLEREEILKLTLSDDINGKDQRLNPLMCVQLTQFECGGEVMYVLCSHKVADLASLTNFINDWAFIARSSRDGNDPPTLNCPPQFNGASFFPPTKLESGGELNSRTERQYENGVSTKRFVFKSSKIASLKGMVCEKVENPTRVQILTAFIYKAAVSAKESVTGLLILISFDQLYTKIIG